MLSPLRVLPNWIITRTKRTKIVIHILQMEKSELREFEYLTKSSQLSKVVELTIQLPSVWLQTPGIPLFPLSSPFSALIASLPSPTTNIFLLGRISVFITKNSSILLLSYLFMWLIKSYEKIRKIVLNALDSKLTVFFSWILYFRRKEKQLSK